MKKHRANFLPHFEESAEMLSLQIEREISEADLSSDSEERHQTRKTLADTLHKLVTIINHVKKLEKLYLEEMPDDSENDRKIIEEFILKIKSEYNN
ncbi:MAG: hypothetical protein SFT91_03315 [Rickettsiaceae bacterium]|nr:hypothetical protein [Rickettsiaceae bacterium]